MDTQDSPTPTTRKREEQLSADGKWRSFPKVPHLLQYVSNANYYGRIKVGGKIIRESLKTNVWTTAKLRLTDFLKDHQEARNGEAPPKFSVAVDLFKRELENRTGMKPDSKKYRLYCLLKLERTWPGLWDLRLNEVTPQACKEWAAKLSREIADRYFNNTIGTLKQVLAVGIRAHKEKGGQPLENPAAELKRVRVKQKDLRLPEPSQFKGLVENLRKNSGGWGPRIGDMVEFLAYSGVRVRSEAILVTWEDVDWAHKEIVVRGCVDTRTKNWEIRRIPIIPDMETLLTRLKGQLGTVATGPILKISKCNEALARACKELKLSKITHHDLRHMFATRCIESGVDILTVSNWLGHKDGGTLALKTYGHLRNEHSQQMAAKVKF